MGGRGAASGMSDDNKPYGSEYSTKLQYKNIKFVIANEGATSSPMETMTKGRVYVALEERTVGKEKELHPKYISYYDQNNKRFKQIDIKGKPHVINGESVLPHTHIGYEHSEHGTRHLTKKEKKMVDLVQRAWYNRNSKK